MTPPPGDARNGDRFRVLFEHSSDAHVIYDDMGRVLDCNDAAVQLLKATDKEQVLAHSYVQFSPEYQPDGSRSAEKLKEIAALARARGFHRFEWMLRRLNGEEVLVEVTRNAVKIDGKPAMISVWHDLTQIKRIEAELRKRTEEQEALNRELVATNEGLNRFRVLFEHSSDAHVIYDDTGRVLDCNDAAIQLLKATDKTQVLAHSYTMFSPEYQPDGSRSAEKLKEIAALARARGFHRFEWMLRRLNGEEFLVEVTRNAVMLDGKPAMISVWHDLTEIKRIESELRKRGEELAALNRELAATNARLKRDLQAAARIQQALLPTILPDTAPARLVWTFRPCEELAGDLLNIFPLDDRQVGLYLLDVSGHGVAASLLSVTVSHLLTPHGDASLLKVPSPNGSPGRLARPSEVIHRLNAQLCPDNSEQFFTLFYGILDLGSYTLRYANAGHPGPMVLSERAEPTVLQNSGLPAGITEQAEYEDAEVVLQPGDRFWLYSDGLVEAMNAAGEQWGKGRLLTALQAVDSDSLTDTVRRVLREVETWTGDRGPQDDISLIALEIGRS
jgi:sigma-B regulation protein RsbU (phosphoserine phosphatase)